jgi:molecular chaperone GrpE (heat shock protein)
MSDVTESVFALVMQELSAEAAAPLDERKGDRVSSGITALLSAVHSLGQRLESLEESVVRNFESIHFQKIEAQLAAIRETESVNQKLFDSLHQELISYRDNFVRESLQKPVIRDLLVLFDDLNSIATQFEQAAASEECRALDVRGRDNIRNMLYFLLEVLLRLEVHEIEERERVDLTLHRVIAFEATDQPEEEGLIVKRIRRGFIWRGSILRPEEVIARRVR